MNFTHYLPVYLKFTSNLPVLHIRGINGNDELYIQNTNASTAIGLINRLMVQNGNTTLIPPEKIVTADRDRILTFLYVQLFGEKIEGTLTCNSCAKPYEIDFNLLDLEKHLGSENPKYELSDGYFKTEECKFRLPTGEDELAISGLSSDKAVDALLKRCTIEGSKDMADQIQVAMAKIAPLMQTEMPTTCPECGAEQQANFDLQSYLLGKLKQEQKVTIRDVHRLASVYKWSHHEILELPRRLRRMYVKMVEAEMML